MYSHLAQVETDTVQNTTLRKSINHGALLSAAVSLEAAEKIVLDALLQKLSRVLSVDVSNLDPNKSNNSTVPLTNGTAGDAS